MDHEPCKKRITELEADCDEYAVIVETQREIILEQEEMIRALKGLLSQKHAESTLALDGVA